MQRTFAFPDHKAVVGTWLSYFSASLGRIDWFQGESQCPVTPPTPLSTFDCIMDYVNYWIDRDTFRGFLIQQRKLSPDLIFVLVQAAPPYPSCRLLSGRKGPGGLRPINCHTIILFTLPSHKTWILCEKVTFSLTVSNCCFSFNDADTPLKSIRWVLCMF